MEAEWKQTYFWCAEKCITVSVTPVLMDTNGTGYTRNTFVNAVLASED